MSALINLGKYLSSFPVIWTSALRHHLASDELTMDSYDQHLQVARNQVRIIMVGLCLIVVLQR